MKKQKEKILTAEIPEEAAGLSVPAKSKIEAKKDFVIETLEWKWHPNVKSPNVYRKEEFIRSSTKNEALDAAKFLLNKPVGLTYTITVERNEDFFTYYRHSQPCYGSLCKYFDQHGPEHFYNPYFPRDIKVAFPEGEIIFIGVCREGMKKALETSYFEFLFSEESPWIGAFGKKESVIFGDNFFILTNMKTGDPTVFYSLLRLGGLAGGYYGEQISGKLHSKVYLLLTKVLNPQSDPRRLCGQKPIVFPNHFWNSKKGYVRPYCESVWKTNLPTKLKDFGSLPTTSYPPQFTFTNEYFVSEMKKVFKIDVAGINSNNIDEKTQQIFLESWDYFRDKAGELNDE